MNQTIHLSLVKSRRKWPLVFLAIVVIALLVLKPEWSAGTKALQVERDALVIKNDSLLAIKLLLDKQLKESHAVHNRCERENEKLRQKLLNFKHPQTND